jgi:3-isopropylmalate/(R)-2-methylmalate dehydratase small subunit
MMEEIITGKAFYCGDFVDTDVMSPGRFEPYSGRDHLASMALIDYESKPPFVDQSTGRSPFKIIFAGHEFGCGSSRETAPQALAYAGAQVIIAKSFARIFFRNCVNMGLLLPIIYEHSYDENIIGAEVTVNFVQQFFTVHGRHYEFGDFGPLTAIIKAGGLTNYNKQRLGGEL